MRVGPASAAASSATGSATGSAAGSAAEAAATVGTESYDAAAITAAGHAGYVTFSSQDL